MKKFKDVVIGGRKNIGKVLIELIFYGNVMESFFLITKILD